MYPDSKEYKIKQVYYVQSKSSGVFLSAEYYSQQIYPQRVLIDKCTPFDTMIAADEAGNQVWPDDFDVFRTYRRMPV